MNKSLWIGVGVLLALLIGAALFLARPKTEVSTNTPAAESTPTVAATAPTTEGEVKQLQVVASEYAFDPASISLSRGDRVSLTFRNMGRLPHNLFIGDLGVSTKTIAGGASDTVEFVADKAGTFSFYCSVPGHRGLGMEGSLEVK